MSGARPGKPAARRAPREEQDDWLRQVMTGSSPIMPCRPTNDDALRAFGIPVIRLRRPLRQRRSQEGPDAVGTDRAWHPHPALHPSCTCRSSPSRSWLR